MALTHTAPFAQVTRSAAVAVTAALTGIGTAAPTGASLLVTAGIDGALVTRLTAMPRGTTTAASLVLFLVKASAPTVYQLVDSELMAAYTMVVTTAIPETAFGNISQSEPLPLEAGDKLFVGSQVALAAGIVFSAQWKDY